MPGAVYPVKLGLSGKSAISSGEAVGGRGNCGRGKVAIGGVNTACGRRKGAERGPATAW